MNSSKAEFGNFCNSRCFILADELHEIPVAVAIILPEELCDLVRHVLRGVRDEELFHCTQR